MSLRANGLNIERGKIYRIVENVNPVRKSISQQDMTQRSSFEHRGVAMTLNVKSTKGLCLY